MKRVVTASRIKASAGLGGSRFPPHFKRKHPTWHEPNATVQSRQRFTTGDRRICRATPKWRRSRLTIPWRSSRAKRSSRCVRSATIPWGKLHSHHQLDEAQYRGGRAFQDDWEKAERGPRAVDPTREYVDGGRAREPITERQRKAVLRLNRAERELGADGSALVHEVLILGHDHGAGRAAARTCAPSAGPTISRDDFANAWTGWR